uniref:Fibronectin type-III domain-containing protein n=2 Tax=Cyprinus carpio TaxID=7962 RepID=A0A8C1R0U4_CYPCA
MDSVGVNLIKTAALGRPFQLGMLYDCRKDELIAGIRFWNKEQLEQNICSRPQINTDFTVTASDSIKDKSNLLNIEGALNLSVLGGLVQVSGAAKYLKDNKTSFIQQRLTLHYHSTCEFKELTVNQLPSENIPDDDNATHVVTGILYGADACFVFDRQVSSDENKSTVKGEVKVALEKLLGVISIDANADLNMNDTEKTAVKNFTCTFYGDFQLPSNPTTFEDAMKVFADLPKLLKDNQKLAVPLRVWLYPLHKLHSRASKLQRDISMDLIQETESVIESLYTAEMKCSDLLEDSPAVAFAAFHDKILQMKQNCYKYKLRLVKKLGSLLPNIRGDVMKETTLNDLLQEHDASPFNDSDLTEWLKERESESEIIKSVLRQLKDCGAHVEDNIDAIMMDLEVGNLVSYTFTSLNCSDIILHKQKIYLSSSTKEEKVQISPDIKQRSWLTAKIQKTMRRNLEIFKSLMNSKDCKPAKFIVSSKEVVNNPGSCILLYESECDEAVCFIPPSKPVCPVTEEVTGQSVVLKVVPPSCPATVELRLLYKVKQDTVWRSEAVLKDQDTVTLTDLRSGAEYEIKCAALGKLNYTRDSDVITVNTESNMRSSAVMEKGQKKITRLWDAHDIKNNWSRKIEGRSNENLPMFKLNLDETWQNSDGFCRSTFGKNITKPNKTIMMIGATGAGKTTLINSMINYILGVQWEDDFRFVLIDEGKQKSQAESQTPEITAYQINHMDGFRVPYSLTIVDTPSFGDTRGISHDQKITKQIHEFFSARGGIDCIDAVCFVVQASLARLTRTEKYVFDYILSILGKDIAQNILVLVTFADGKAPPVLEAIKVAEVPCSTTESGEPLHFKFNNSALFANNNTSADDEESDCENFDKMFWKLGFSSMKKFFTSLITMKTQSLSLTQEVLKERQQLEVHVQGLQTQIKAGLTKLDEIKKTRAALEQHMAMKDGMCTVCPGKCDWDVHFNQKYKWDYVPEKRKETYRDLKKRFEDAHGQVMSKEKIFEELENELMVVQDIVAELIKRSQKSSERLQEIALKPNPLSIPDYIDLMIESEKQEAKPGFEDRIQSLMEVRKKAEIIIKVSTGRVLPDDWNDYKPEIRKRERSYDPKVLFNSIQGYIQEKNNQGMKYNIKQ